MKLTTGQEQLLAACAELDVRSKDQMLSLLLLEAVSYYFMDRNINIDSVHKSVEILENEIRESIGSNSYIAPDID